MDRSFFVVIDRSWFKGDPARERRIRNEGLVPLGDDVRHLAGDCRLLTKMRTPEGRLHIEPDTRLLKLQSGYYLRSLAISRALLDNSDKQPFVSLFFEGTDTEARCIFQTWDDAFFKNLQTSDPTLRLAAYDLPPPRHAPAVVYVANIAIILYRLASQQDAELFASHTSRFLDMPHILTSLFTHVLSIRSEDHLRFPIQLKKIAEHLRQALLESNGPIKIERIPKSHVDLWAKVDGQQFAFLDGGVARIPGMANLEPMALRVGVYSVRPGVKSLEDREQWRMRPFVVGDLVERRSTEEAPDPKRLLEAVRYTAEPLTAISHLLECPTTNILFLHGPLVNQFVTYDEGQPYFLPSLSPRFLSQYQLHEATVVSKVQDIPADARGKKMWNHFMSIYAYIMKAIEESDIPIVGVVERVASRSVTEGMLRELEQANIITAAYTKRVQEILVQYDILDDFLFGCLLKEGEYVTPIRVDKNPIRRARERWQPVVRQYPKPYATMLKTEESNFPFRVEMNNRGAQGSRFVFDVLYHTSRLLPRYAFPVGLDIVDRYAKIPDWLSKGITAELSAAVLKRALQTGDANIVAQVRRLLARGPRDFFYRPTT